MNLYTEDGWINAAGILDEIDADFVFIPGARGIGKTYSFLAELIDRKAKPFIYLRRRPDEAALQANPMFSEIAKVLKPRNKAMTSEKIIGDMWVVRDADDGRDICATGALSTMAGLRGANFDDYDLILFDEYMQEPHLRPIHEEGIALKNLYETVNRNRELENPPRKPVKLICLANAFDIAHDTMREFHLVEMAEQLLNSDEEIIQRGNKCLILPKHSPISERKKETALYKVDEDGDFSDFALQNKFIMNDFSYICNKNLIEYVPRLRVGELYIYKHKERREYYVTKTPAKVSKQYNDNINDLKRFQREQRHYWFLYLDGKIRFDKYNSARIFESYYRAK